ncbi:hypothetical protein MHU86_6659 [Fragilaria crotonensis]|nr:hypothetical protein MHU86_6659 [Fragilaria crotonensis]
MSLFTPMAGLTGGTLIGLAASTLLLLNGDIMDSSSTISPIIAKPVKTLKSQSWKIVFTASFIAAANLYMYFLDPNTLEDTSGLARPLSTVGYQISGLLVGFGSKLGGGCTSGHGICGLARFSRRSFAAVCTFMGFGMATATLFASSEVVQSRTMFLFADSESAPQTPKASVALLFAAGPTV